MALLKLRRSIMKFIQNKLPATPPSLKRRAAIIYALFTILFTSITLAPKYADAYIPNSSTQKYFFGSLFTPFFGTFAKLQELYLNIVATGMKEEPSFSIQKLIQLIESQEEKLNQEKTNFEKKDAPVEWILPDVIRERIEAQGDPIPDYFPYHELWHTVKPGETRKRIEEMYKYKGEELANLNPMLNLDQLMPGQRILVWKRSAIPSQSIGKANRGRLLNGEPLRPTDAFMVLYQHRVFGTQHTVALLQSTFDAYGEHFPGSSPLIVGDIGVRTGRHLAPHHSHQSGRDVDISYPTLIPQATYKRFVRTRIKNLDAKKGLWLLKRFIDTGYIEYIFVDRRLQRQLIKEAEAEGAPEEWIASVFQYRGKPNAIIRHARGHINHFHIRFRCSAADHTCRDSIRDRKHELARLAESQGEDHAAHELEQQRFETQQAEDEQEEEIELQ